MRPEAQNLSFGVVWSPFFPEVDPQIKVLFRSKAFFPVAIIGQQEGGATAAAGGDFNILVRISGRGGNVPDGNKASAADGFVSEPEAINSLLRLALLAIWYSMVRYHMVPPMLIGDQFNLKNQLS